MVIGGQVILAGVEQAPEGTVPADLPAAASASAWAAPRYRCPGSTGDDIVVSRTDPAHPVSYVNLDGVRFGRAQPKSGGPGGLRWPPIRRPVYVAGQRGVMRLSNVGQSRTDLGVGRGAPTDGSRLAARAAPSGGIGQIG